MIIRMLVNSIVIIIPTLIINHLFVLSSLAFEYGKPREATTDPAECLRRSVDVFFDVGRVSQNEWWKEKCPTILLPSFRVITRWRIGLSSVGQALQSAYRP